MPKASHSEQVQAPVETIWRLLLDKIENPGRYLAGIGEVEILEREAGALVRQSVIAGVTVVERVTAFEKRHEVDAVLTDEAPYAGQSRDRIEAPLRPGLAATLTLSLDWRRKDGQPDGLDLSSALRDAVQKIKAQAEGA